MSCSQACQEAHADDCDCSACGGAFHGVKRRGGHVDHVPPGIVVQPDLAFDQSNGHRTAVGRAEASANTTEPQSERRRRRSTEQRCDGCGRPEPIAFMVDRGNFCLDCAAEANRWP